MQVSCQSGAQHGHCAARRRPQRTAPAGLVLLAEVDRTAMSEFSARGKVVVVTGGANGIGAALCRRFASEGASKVVVVDLNVGVAESLAATLPEHVGVAVGADCGSELDLRRVIVQTEFEHGPIGVFVANAGIPSNGSFDVTDREWARIWRINTMQQLWVARHLFPRWIARGAQAPPLPVPLPLTPTPDP